MLLLLTKLAQMEIDEMNESPKKEVSPVHVAEVAQNVLANTVMDVRGKNPAPKRQRKS